MSAAGFTVQEVGILGGGQLARMLAESAARMGLLPVAYSESEDCPARAFCSEIVVGRIDDPGRLAAFVSRLPLIAFENEFVDCEALARAAPSLEDRFLPSLAAIRTLQDKLAQKKLLLRLRIPSAPFTELDPRLGFDREIERARKGLGGGIVLKWSRSGYDGKGVRIVTRDEEQGAAVRFCAAAAERGIPVYAEARVEFRRELAVVGCASADSTQPVACYPLVVTEQQQGICRWVRGPATLLGAPTILQEKARMTAGLIARETGLVGCFGVEFFETSTGELWLNEIAPRVHNTGHYTQNACATSQFENHWRALLGLPLGETTPLARCFAMLNVLGCERIEGHPTASASIPLPLPTSRIQLHWYGKAELRAGRKLGHLNGTAESPEALQSLLAELEKCDAAWRRSAQIGGRT